ncbi:MAG: hypothetical protein Greene041619_151 [Candidatus Peregrinibacteria bacterium Greene0416_19]|nr:MAG: hypothetical protein Greene041619_151 [Candidatus Peregrinibacteria bacterium Greene0416_19]
MRRLFLRCAILTVTLMWPAAVIAEPPPVTGLAARYESGAIRINWDRPVATDTVAYYHVYYSRRSIVENSGQYDDFETTVSSKPEYTLTTYPSSDVLYIAVLAVDDEGEESAYFTEEVRVNLKENEELDEDEKFEESASSPLIQASNFSSSSSSSITPTTVRLLAAQPLSSTGVILEFSEPVSVDPQQAVSAFNITDGSGNTLVLRRLTFQGTKVRIVTMPQQPEMTYTVRVSDVVKARRTGPDGAGIPLDPLARTASFTGNGEADTGETVMEQEPLPAVSDLQMSFEADGEGRYTVTATWSYPEEITIAGFAVDQNMEDGGSVRLDAVSPEVRTVRIPGVQPGTFGLSVRAESQDGRTSVTVTSTIDLPISPPTEGNLTDSGPIALLALMGAGAGAGWWRARRKKRQASAE